MGCCNYCEHSDDDLSDQCLDFYAFSTRRNVICFRFSLREGSLQPRILAI